MLVATWTGKGTRMVVVPDVRYTGIPATLKKWVKQKRYERRMRRIRPYRPPLSPDCCPCASLTLCLLEPLLSLREPFAGFSDFFPFAATFARALGDPADAALGDRKS